MTVVCKCVHYSGHVQGVGFRYSAQRLAAAFKVAGHVRNLSNGEVELVAEGDASEVDQFLTAVAQQMANYINQTVVHEESLAGRQGFHIRY